jgi:MOSC domain-containing protein YiiM
VQVISVNVGYPREVVWKGKSVSTGIFKAPVEGRIMMRALNLDGDEQADLSVHGGIEKAIYAYATGHYPYWRQELPEEDFPWGAFGENLSIEGLSEADVNIGDRFRLGNAEVMVTQPRFPCYKLNLKFGRDDMVKRFLNSRLSGIYFSVVQEGEVGAGDRVERIYQDDHNVTVADVVQIYVGEAEDDLVHRALQVPALAACLREDFQQRMERRN